MGPCNNWQFHVANGGKRQIQVLKYPNKSSPKSKLALIWFYTIQTIYDSPCLFWGRLGVSGSMLGMDPAHLALKRIERATLHYWLTKLRKPSSIYRWFIDWFIDWFTYQRWWFSTAMVMLPEYLGFSPQTNDSSSQNQRETCANGMWPNINQLTIQLFRGLKILHFGRSADFLIF